MSGAHDVVVVGTGPGGSAAGYYLARRGVDVLLLDKSEFPREKTCGDGLTPRAVAVLDEMGLLPPLARVGRHIDGVEVFAPDGYSTGARVSPTAAPGPPMLVVPRLLLDNALRERAVQSGARFEGRFHVADIEQAPTGVIIRGERDGHREAIVARMAIVATGASVALLVRMGLLERAPRMMLAARAYVDGADGLDGRIQIRFDDVPLPGYGWVFPLAGASANVGVGFYPSSRMSGHARSSPRAAFDRFVRAAMWAGPIGQGRLASPVKAYPLRVDFPEAPTSRGRVMLVGEAAGLVNPLTGEGIDYALESGRLAAEHAARMFADGDFSPGRFAAYDAALRRRFERLFTFCRRLRDLSLSGPVLDRLVRLASRRDELKTALVDIVLGNREVSETLLLKAMLKRVFVGIG